MPYTFTDANQLVGKRPRAVYWTELHHAVNDLDVRVSSTTGDSAMHVSRTDNPHNVTTEQVNIINYKPASDEITTYPVGLTAFQVTEDTSTGYPSVYGIVETLHLSEDRNIQHFFDKPGTDSGYTYYRRWDKVDVSWTKWERLVTKNELDAHTDNKNIHFSSTERAKLKGISEGATKVEDSSTNGNIKITDENKITSDINVYTHPSGDGFLHVPATGTISNKKVLKAGSTAGSIAWSQVRFDEVTGSIVDNQHGYLSGGSLHNLVTQSTHGFMSKEDKKKLDAISGSASKVEDSTINGNILVNDSEIVVYTHPTTHPATIIVEDSSRRFVSDSEKARWNNTYTKTETDSKYLHKTNNLSDISDIQQARNNLGITVSSTEPASPIQGHIWIDTN